MTDPLGLIGSSGGLSPQLPRPGVAGSGPPDGPDFKELLRAEIQQVNDLQRDAKEATEDLAAGRRDDLEGVLIANAKADLAFNMLLQVRNKVMDAYEDVRQIRV